MVAKTVLILEDNEAMRQYLGQLVRDTVQEVHIYSTDNKEEAYQYAIKNSVDVFLVDIILNPDKEDDASGLDFVENIRGLERYFFTPVIMITSLDTPRMYSYEELHCFGYIEKPFQSNKVKELLQQALKFPGKSMEKKKLYFRKSGIVIPVECESIVYVTCIHHVLYIHMENGEVLDVPYITLKQFLADAEDTGLLQCNRNTVINKIYVENIDFVNRYITLKALCESVEIGITFKNNLKDVFRIL